MPLFSSAFARRTVTLLFLAGLALLFIVAAAAWLTARAGEHTAGGRRRGAEALPRGRRDAQADRAKAAALEDIPEAIRFIRASTGHMDALINAILKLSREGPRELNPESFANAIQQLGLFLSGMQVPVTD